MPTSTALKFQLKIGGLAPDTFRVLEFTLDESISECFRLILTARSEEADFAYNDLVGQDATLEVRGEDFTIKHHGVVMEFNQYPDASANFGHNSYPYQIIIEPHLKLLAYTIQSRIFQRQTVKDILTKVLEGEGLAAGTHFEFQLQGSFPIREYTVQYNESNLRFVTRLMEDEGIFYFFNHEGGKDVLVLADKVEAVKPVFQNPSTELHTEVGLSHMAIDHVTKLHRVQKMVTGKVTLKDYNDRTPAVDIMGRATKVGRGEDYSYGPHVLTSSEAERIATLRAEMYACQKVILNGEGICRDFRAGNRFELKDTRGISAFEGKYTLVSVRHKGDQREGFEGDQAQIIYQNSFTCIPAETVFRPQRVTNGPKINGVMTARVDGPEGQYAYLDNDGCYHAKFPFDLSDSKDGQASLPIRLAQPYGGPNYGMHFPLHNGNDLVLGFVDGDADRPIALGTTPNPRNGSPVTAKNKSESIIKTASNHQLRMDDKEGATIIDLQTSGNHLLALNDAPASRQVKIKTSGGHLFLMDDTGKNVTVLTTGGHTLKIDDVANSITVETKGGHSLVMDDPGKKIDLKDGQGVNAIVLDGGGKFLSLSSTGDIKIDAGKNLIITAKDAITMDAGKDMSLHANGAGSWTVDKGMVQEAVKDFTTKAKKIGITAETDYTVAANKMSFKADNDFKVDSDKVTLKASGDMTLKGSKIAQN